MNDNYGGSFQHVPYVSSGNFPPPEQISELVTEAHRSSKTNTDGVNSKVYPALKRMPASLTSAFPARAASVAESSPFPRQGRPWHIRSAARRPGNSVRGQLVAKVLSEEPGVDIVVPKTAV